MTRRTDSQRTDDLIAPDAIDDTETTDDQRFVLLSVKDQCYRGRHV
jgi:hypothetical protein